MTMTMATETAQPSNSVLSSSPSPSLSSMPCDKWSAPPSSQQDRRKQPEQALRVHTRTSTGYDSLLTTTTSLDGSSLSDDNEEEEQQEPRQYDGGTDSAEQGTAPSTPLLMSVLRYEARYEAVQFEQKTKTNKANSTEELGTGLSAAEPLSMSCSSSSKQKSSLSSWVECYPSYNSFGDLFGASPLSQQESQVNDKNDDANANNKSQERRVWSWVCLYIFLPTLIYKSCQRATIPVLPVLIRSDLSGTDYEIGLVLACVGMGKLLGNLPSGQFVAVFGSSHGLMAACLALAVAWLTAAMSHSVRILFVASYLEGLGLALWQVARQNLVTEQIGIDEGRGKVQSTIGGLERFSAVLGPSAGGWLAANSGLRAPFAVKSLLMTGNMLLLWITQRLGWSGRSSQDYEEKDKNIPADTTSLITTAESAATATRIPMGQQSPPPSLGPRDVGSSSSSSKKMTDPASVHAFGRNLKTVVHERGKDLRQIAIWAMLFPIARETRTFLFPLRAMDLGYGPHEIGLMTSITFVVDTILFPLSGYLTDAYGRKYCGVPAGLLIALSYFLAPIWGNDLWTLTAISALGGVGNGLSGGVLNSVGSDLAPRQHRALFLGTFRIVSDMGILLGPLISGFLSQHLGKQAFWVVAALSAFSSLYMALVLPETRWQRQGQLPKPQTSVRKLSTTGAAKETFVQKVPLPTTKTTTADVATTSTQSICERSQKGYGSIV